MAKVQTVTAGVLVMAGVLLRPLALLAPRMAPGTGAQEAPEGAARPDLEVSGEGPWIASCKYWAPVRQEVPSASTGTKLSVQIDASSKDFKEHEISAVDPEQACKGSADPWGLPGEKNAAKNVRHVTPSITAIIAAVPTPVHSRLALQFDRTLDALLEAAADNEYVQSYYWLPWANSMEAAKQGSISAATESERKERERQPGLIILKHVPPPPFTDPDCKHPGPTEPAFCNAFDAAYDRVIFLFLVGNTPVEGMDGYQLNRAFQYEHYLQDHLPAGSVRFSMKKPGEIDIIGSEASGSAASMREAIIRALPGTNQSAVHVAGGASTELAAEIYSTGDDHPGYVSFGDNSAYEVKQFLGKPAGQHHVAFLIEDGTAYATAYATKLNTDRHHLVILRYPLGISTLRNAQLDEQSTTQQERVPTPFLPFSWRDTAPEDSVPHFPTRQLPLSQQAQLDEIAHQLNRNRIELIVIQGSSVLDEIFLANFLHRTAPDARLVSLGGGDLLEEHEINNLPLIGSITIAPYTLITPSSTYSTKLMRAFPDRNSQTTYNAASFTLWKDDRVAPPLLTNYTDFFDPSKPMHPSLWATVIGRDGFYPIEVVNDCASDNPLILPSLETQQYVQAPCIATPNAPPGRVPFVGAVPLSWFVSCAIISLLCIIRSVVLVRANFWMPSIRDLAVSCNDEPHRRSLYINIGTIMLSCMAFVIAYPIYPVGRLINTGTNSRVTAILTILCGVIVLGCTARETHKYLRPYKTVREHRDTDCSGGAVDQDKAAFYILFQIVALLALFTITGLWVRYCGIHAESADYNRLFFSYRCLHLTSGVSPLTPILLLLGGWYAWSIMQTRRLRFSLRAKPALPRRIGDMRADLLFVSEEELATSAIAGEISLYSGITSLLITREVVRGAWSRTRYRTVDICVIVGYLTLVAAFLWLAPIQGIESLFYVDTLSYGRLIEILFLPLLVIAISGWLRTLLIWNALNRSLLWRLEECPIRTAFSRMKNVSWMLMMRQNGMVQRWREMARSTESMRQLLHLPQIQNAINPQCTKNADDLTAPDYPGYVLLMRHIDQIMTLVGCDSNLLHQFPEASAKGAVGTHTPQVIDAPHESSRKLVRRIQRNREDRNAVRRFMAGGDLPETRNRAELLLMYLVENDYAEFATVLLKRVLIPYWQDKKTGFVESEAVEAPALPATNEKAREGRDKAHPPAEAADEIPPHIQLAEEFVAIRYVSLIRAVLVNIRHLITFVSLSFVFSIVSWNSYPFRPRDWADTALTGILILAGGGIIWVFAQMHRDPILSRLTGTRANELGSEFYLRVLSYGTLPVLTWLAYQFPAISNEILKYFQPEMAGAR